MIHVCQVATLTRWGGVERMLVDLLEATTATPGAVQQHVLTTSSIEELLTPLHHAGLDHFQPQRRTRYDPTALIQMASWLRSRRIQALHSYNAYANVWGHLAGRLAGVPLLIAGEHGTVNSVRGPMAFLDALTYRRAPLVAANSQAIARALQRRYRVPAGKIRIVYNAVAPLPPADLPALHAELNLPPGPIVGTVGRLDTVKDYATLIRSAALVVREHPTATFLIVGGGPQEAALRAMVAAAGLDARIRLTGWRADARAVLQLCTIFVSTSLSESFGNVLVEAALAGIPVIASAVGGVPEAVVDQQTGILLRPTEPLSLLPDGAPPPPFTDIDGERTPTRSLAPATLAAAILDLLNDPERCARYGNAGRTRAERLFSMARYRQDLEHLYRSPALSG